MTKEIKIKTIVSDNRFSQNSYLCYNDDVMFMVDCGCTKEVYISALGENGLFGRKLDCIFLTHTHFDHIMGLFDVWDIDKCNIYISKGCEDFIYDKIKNVSAYFGGFECKAINKESIKSIEDCQKIQMSGNEVAAYTTKGHSLCSMCYMFGDILFTGDTILEGTIGRQDLYGGSSENMEKSLLKIRKIPFKVAYPGHGKPLDFELVNGIINFYT